MSEPITSTKEKFLSLSAISQGIRTAIQSKFGDQLLWIVAEISEMSVRKGHCYLSLVEKLPGNSAPVCEMKGIVWATKFERIHSIFQKATGNELRSGSVILFQASVRFDVKWGLSLIVEDIEPKYTIGLLQQERDKTIAALREEGIFNNNRLLPFPLVPQRIAAISARDSRGYEDFINKLETNSKGYKFDVDLYPSLLQGEKAAGEMVDRLIRIFNNKEKYDLVVIVRGGGGAIDLNCFNDYRLSRAVARFPIPVLTGIGHTTNKSVIDEVAHADAITPTDAADFILEKTANFELGLDQMMVGIKDAFESGISAEALRLNELSSEIRSSVEKRLQHENYYVEGSAAQIRNFSMNTLNQARSNLGVAVRELSYKTQQKIIRGEMLLQEKFKVLHSLPQGLLKMAGLKLSRQEGIIQTLDPVNVLKRGFSITLHNGKAIKSAESVQPGAVLKTILYEGTIESEVKGK